VAYEEKYTDREQRNLERAKLFFGGNALKTPDLFAEDVVWWNGVPPPPHKPQVNNHVGRETIVENLKMATSGAFKTGDWHDLSTAKYVDQLWLADGDWVIRLQTMLAVTTAGTNWHDTYCFIFRFNPEGQIDQIIQHSNVLQKYRTIYEGGNLGFPFETVKLSNRGEPRIENPSDPSPWRA
jgi:hypothetical protein